MKKPLNQYTGFLSASQTAHGINAAALNARRLAEDAQLLHDAGRFPSAASLAILALEELGKSTILRQLFLANSEKELAEQWRRYRKHTQKNYFALMPDLMGRGAAKLYDLKELFAKEGELHRATYDTVKQLGFYTDCCGIAHWSIPSEVIDGTLAAFLVSLATALSKEKQPVTTKELDLWKFHMSAGCTQTNLLRWCSAMVEAGLKPPGYVEEMRHFTQDSQTNSVH
jgi:AbiV family abortive infection protein